MERWNGQGWKSVNCSSNYILMIFFLLHVFIDLFHTPSLPDSSHLACCPFLSLVGREAHVSGWPLWCYSIIQDFLLGRFWALKCCLRPPYCHLPPPSFQPSLSRKISRWLSCHLQLPFNIVLFYCGAWIYWSAIDNSNYWGMHKVTLVTWQVWLIYHVTTDSISAIYEEAWAIYIYRFTWFGCIIESFQTVKSTM